jgi:hypothetical protein
MPLSIHDRLADVRVARCRAARRARAATRTAERRSCAALNAATSRLCASRRTSVAITMSLRENSLMPSRATAMAISARRSMKTRARFFAGVSTVARAFGARGPDVATVICKGAIFSPV